MTVDVPERLYLAGNRRNAVDESCIDRAGGSSTRDADASRVTIVFGLELVAIDEISRGGQYDRSIGEGVGPIGLELRRTARCDVYVGADCASVVLDGAPILRIEV